jgi:hypothetical protein
MLQHVSERILQAEGILVDRLLYATSGALWNLSRHPGNHGAFYQAELQVIDEAVRSVFF